MALKNAKNYEGHVARNGGILCTDQLQIVTRAAVPTDSDLANGRIVYVTGTGLRAYIGDTWVTIPTSTSGGSASSWDTLYASDKSLTINGASLTFAGTHATNDVITITGSGTGAALQITNSSTGADVSGTSATWSVSAAGAAVFTAVTGCDTLTAASDLAIDANGTGTITLAGTSTGGITLTTAVTATESITITGTADADCLTVTAGDVKVSNGILSLDSDDTTTGNLTIPSSTATSGNVVTIVADDITSGACLFIDSDNGASFSGNGGYVHISDGTNPVMTVGRYGATVLAGNASTDIFTITAGNAVLTAGNFTQTDGIASITTTGTSSALTIVADSVTDGNVIDVNADGVTTGVLLHLDSSATGFNGKYIQCYDGAADEFSVGLDGATIITTTSAGTVGLTLTHGGTTGDAMQITCSALTTGDALQISQTAETFAAGELLKITNTENGDLSATPKTGNVASITSSVTATTSDTTLDYDTLLISRSNIVNQGTKTLTASGSVLKLMNTSTNTAGTCTDTTVTLEVLTADGGTAAPTGDAVKITSVGVGAKAINVISASTTVSDVLLTGSGVKANGKAVLEIASTGSTAAGGALLKVAHSGTGDPAAATSYIASFSQASATCANNPVAVIINAGASTAAGLQITGSGASAGGLLELNSTATGALGAVLKFDQTANSAAASDVIGRLLFTAQDAGNAAEEYARVDVVIRDTTNASEDADILFYVDRAGTLTQQLQLDSDINGIVVGDGAADAYVGSNGAYDLILNTNAGSSSGTITIANGANGDITVAPNGTGQTILTAASFTNTAVTTTKTMSIAEIGFVTCTSAGGTYSITLPAVATSAGAWYVFKKTDAAANAITLDANASETIDGATTVADIDAQYDTIGIYCDGSAWHIFTRWIH